MAEVLLYMLHSMERHSPLRPAADSTGLIGSKIYTCRRSEHPKNFPERRFVFTRIARAFARMIHIGMLAEAHQLARDLFRGQNEIHAARRHGATRHPIVLGRL